MSQNFGDHPAGNPGGYPGGQPGDRSGGDAAAPLGQKLWALREKAALALLVALALTVLLGVIDFLYYAVTASLRTGAAAGASDLGNPLLTVALAVLVVLCAIKDPTPKVRQLTQGSLLVGGIGLGLGVLLALVGELGRGEVSAFLSYLAIRVLTALAVFTVLQVSRSMPKPAPAVAAQTWGPSYPTQYPPQYPAEQQGYSPSQGRQYQPYGDQTPQQYASGQQHFGQSQYSGGPYPTPDYPQQSYPNQSFSGDAGSAATGGSAASAASAASASHPSSAAATDQVHGERSAGSYAATNDATDDPSNEETNQFRWSWPQNAAQQPPDAGAGTGGEETRQLPAVEDHGADHGDDHGDDHGQHGSGEQPGPTSEGRDQDWWNEPRR